MVLPVRQTKARAALVGAARTLRDLVIFGDLAVLTGWWWGPGSGPGRAG